MPMFRIAVLLIAVLGVLPVWADSVLYPCTGRDAVADTVAAPASGMKMIWVPDTLVDRVQGAIDGRYDIVSRRHAPDDNEKVLLKGDTVSMVIREKNIGRFSRGLFNYLFIPKNTWQFGITASYGEFSSTDLQLFDILSDFDFTGHTFSVRPYISYFIKNNFSVGMRLGYNSSKASLGKLAMEFDDDINLDISDVMYRNEALTAAIFARQYIGLARKGRFGVFNELELAFSSGNSDFRRNYDGKPKLTNTTYTDFNINFSPGLCVFINPYVSFNVAFAVVGFYLRNEKQSVDGEYSGNRFTSGANFRFNLFNINFGLGIHL